MEEEQPGAEEQTAADTAAAPSQPPEPMPPAAPAPPRPPELRPERTRGPRPELTESREPLYRVSGGYTLRLDPPDLARLRELPGSKGKTDRELGELFLDGQAARLTGAVSDDVPVPAEVRVVVDPYSRQAFLAVGKTIRGIVSF
jgi:hypothetical protein